MALKQFFSSLKAAFLRAEAQVDERLAQARAESPDLAKSKPWARRILKARERFRPTPAASSPEPAATPRWPFVAGTSTQQRRRAVHPTKRRAKRR